MSTSASQSADAPPLPDMKAVFGPSRSEQEKSEESEKQAEAPLPEIPPLPMSVDQAYALLGVTPENRGNLDKLKMAFRKMSLKWHPGTRHQSDSRVIRE